jgi:hypothetical protein
MWKGRNTLAAETTKILGSDRLWLLALKGPRDLFDSASLFLVKLFRQLGIGISPKKRLESRLFFLHECFQLLESFARESSFDTVNRILDILVCFTHSDESFVYCNLTLDRFLSFS